MREAGELARATSRTDFKRWTKGDDHSPVSEADIAVDKLLRERLTALAPGAGWLSEETEDHPPDRQRWRARGSSIRSTAPALLFPAAPTGRSRWRWWKTAARSWPSIYAPVTEEMFLAVRGQGARLNGAAIAASGGEKLAGAKLAGPKRYLDRLSLIAPGMLPQPKVHSLALRLTRVAHGELDAAFASPGSHDWDLAAADLLVHEAGGAMTDFSGQALRYNAPLVVHGALIAAGPARLGTLIDLVRNRKLEFA